MDDPFGILGIPTSATASQIRAAFRRLALRHHPDRNPRDTGAAERFKRIVTAYRSALRGPGEQSAAPPAGPRPDRFGCGSCGDTFPFSERCPRCDVALHDRHEQEAVAPSDPRVDTWMREMEARRIVDGDEDTSERLPAPGLMAAGFLGAACVVWTLGGPLGPALLFAGFAAYVVAVEGHRVVEPIWARRE